MSQISLRDGQNSPPEKKPTMGMKSWWSWKLQEMKGQQTFLCAARSLHDPVHHVHRDSRCHLNHIELHLF